MPSVFIMPVLLASLVLTGCSGTVTSKRNQAQENPDASKQAVEAQATQRPKADLSEVLNNKKLWGKDFHRVVLEHAQNWEGVGKPQIAVFSDHIGGFNVFANKTEAIESTRELRESWGEEPPDAALKFKDCKKTLTGPFGVVIQIPEHLPQTCTGFEIKTAAPSKPLELLPPGLTLTEVKKELGGPENVTQELIQTEYERRPAVVTYYRYANGAITYALSDMAPDDDEVQSVAIDPSKSSQNHSPSREPTEKPKP